MKVNTILFLALIVAVSMARGNAKRETGEVKEYYLRGAYPNDDENRDVRKRRKMRVLKGGSDEGGSDEGGGEGYNYGGGDEYPQGK